MRPAKTTTDRSMGTDRLLRINPTHTRPRVECEFPAVLMRAQKREIQNFAIEAQASVVDLIPCASCHGIGWCSTGKAGIARGMILGLSQIAEALMHSPTTPL